MGLHSAIGVLAVATACGAADEAPRAREQARAPSLAVVSQQPLVVRGVGFRAGERVKLLVTVGGRAAPTGAARASASGRFTARLGSGVGPADAVVVQAIGAGGSRAMVDVAVPTGTLAPRP